ncbi:MAG: hypothetical protein KKA67_13450 [Spirochaetes bacterium]|nr:hypothetical protein [Spirochaetota bacterium]MBU1079582.1 hypothetical protein [Spirochaetota bacterium]
MCSYCGTPLPVERIGFRDLCESCGRELHACVHCRFYKPGAYRDCLETVPDTVKDKERMNFCEYFKADPATVKGSGGQDSSKAAKSAFDGLFGH